MADVRTSLRALAHPGSVLALVVLVLNDHVLKQAWPGWVTGKLSDVAGLVVAPLLLGALLTLLRVPRAVPAALAATGVGFVFCKTSAVGAAATSAVWSLFGTPTIIRADVTDLVALPAICAAWAIHRRTARSDGAGWRRTVSVALGVAVLPVGVLATSATSCSESEGYQAVGVVRGEFTGPPRQEETRLAVGELTGARFSVDRSGDFLTASFELDGPLDRSSRTCLGSRCWRLIGEDAVDASTDGGRTWTREAELTEADRDRITEDVGTDDGCDDAPPAVGASDVAALRVDAGDLVIVTLQRGGVWRRDPAGTWTVLTESEVRDLIRDDSPPPPVVTELDGTDTPDDPDVPDVPGSGQTGPPCPTPSTTTVTPHPSNGPPTTYDVCV
ncbi:hypothetical protein IEZ26_20570 [Nocardioides cavernae]|uniref:Uncharacterized protein n=1 Tax=Nocardioides cavernae TaxID=1921566 RepID=A0ABR8NFY0_9ACTN|nr:hypothetical protein [Nocardioides cavernae]MBD3927027.1 hypothetical protein [Nocardioides cavernae]MBM7512747.1 hypothetical protein [Nocardioides cavernae]